MGNIPAEIIAEYRPALTAPIMAAKATGGSSAPRTPTRCGASYPRLRRVRPDGPIASILARAVPQVLRLSLTYALIDGSGVIDEGNLSARWRCGAT